jgi:hypothetical protein
VVDEPLQVILRGASVFSIAVSRAGAIRYIRVSTKDERQNAFGPEAQTLQLETYCAASG